jgi:hypothetical protein
MACALEADADERLLSGSQATSTESGGKRKRLESVTAMPHPPLVEKGMRRLLAGWLRPTRDGRRGTREVLGIKVWVVVAEGAALPGDTVVAGMAEVKHPV